MALVVAVWVAGPASAAPRRAPCATKDRVLARTDAVVVSMHVRSETDNRGPGRSLLACRVRSGRVREIDDSPYWFGPPARSVSIAGNLVGYAEQVGDDGVSASDHTGSCTAIREC